jgi:hypothetical protein
LALRFIFLVGRGKTVFCVDRIDGSLHSSVKATWQVGSEPNFSLGGLA